MKKFIIFLILLLFFNQTIYAGETTDIQFIYINGSNNNDKKMKNWFFNGIKKMHPNMYKAFSESSFIKSKLLQNGKYKISENPETFFWGDKSNEEIKILNSDLNITKFFSPRLAQVVRSLLAHCLHDAIWVSHYRNMHPVIIDLHKQVMRNYKNGKSVVLFGYSAGAFVTYEYLFNKLPNIDFEEYCNTVKVSDEFKNFVKNNKRKNTCIDALIASGLAIYTADDNLILMIDSNNAKETYNNLDKYTCSECIPPGALNGIVNYASPLVLFYSDISNPNYSMTYYNKLLYKYLLENNMFWITVNYADDPLGYPTSKNVSYKDIKDKIKLDIILGEGFIYSKSNVKSRKTFIGAHTSYWATSKKFSKAVVKAYEEGYKLFNEDDL